MIESKLRSIKVFLVKAAMKIGHDKYLLLILFLKLILGHIKLKIKTEKNKKKFLWKRIVAGYIIN